MDNHRDKNNNLFQMINLVHVTPVNEALTEVVSQWQRVGVGKEEETEYDLRRRMYFRKLYTAGAHKGQESFYWFELQQYESMKWRMIHMEPFSEAYNHQYEILPTDIIEKIAETKVNPDRVVTRKNVRSGVMNKTVDLKFVRFSDTYMFGTVKGHDTGEARESVRWDGDMETSFLAFFDYRDKYPARVMEFVKAFAGDLLPDLVEEGWKPAAEPGGAVRVPDPELNIVPFDGLSGPWEEWEIVTLYDLIALSKDPLYNRLLFLKLGELQSGLLSDDIRAFEDKKEYYKEKLRRCIGMEDCIKNGRPRPYWFVLTRFAPGDWGMTKIEPWPPAYEYFKEVLPPELFRRITGTPVDPDTVVEASIKMSFPLRKHLDILWVRYSPNCVMGVVRQGIDEWKRLVTEQKDRLEEDSKLKGAAYYNLLFDLFRRDEGVAKVFINRFMTEVMPRLKEKETGTRARAVFERPSR